MGYDGCPKAEGKPEGPWLFREEKHGSSISFARLLHGHLRAVGDS